MTDLGSKTTLRVMVILRGAAASKPFPPQRGRTGGG